MPCLFACCDFWLLEIRRCQSKILKDSLSDQVKSIIGKDAGDRINLFSSYKPILK